MGAALEQSMALEGQRGSPLLVSATVTTVDQDCLTAVVSLALITTPSTSGMPDVQKVKPSPFPSLPSGCSILEASSPAPPFTDLWDEGL